MNEPAFENGERVATSQISQGPDEILADRDDQQAPDDLSLTFNFDEVESKEIQELVEHRIEAEVRKFKSEINLARADATKKILLLMIDAALPRRAAYQIAYAAGMGAMVGGSASSIARRFGTSKEAFEQEGDRLLASLDIRKNALMKSTEAAKTYSKTNYRKDTIK